MKRVAYGVLAVAAAAGAVIAGPSAAFAAAPATGTVTPASACTATTAGISVSGSCTVSTSLGSFGGTFTGTIGLDGMASGTIVLHGGVLGDMNGTWTGGLFNGPSATIDYTVQTPVGSVSGSFTVSVN